MSEPHRVHAFCLNSSSPLGSTPPCTAYQPILDRSRTCSGPGRLPGARLMREAGLNGGQVRWYLVRTTDSSRNDSIAPNLLSKATVPTKSY